MYPRIFLSIPQEPMTAGTRAGRQEEHGHRDAVRATKYSTLIEGSRSSAPRTGTGCHVDAGRDRS